jgi:heme oxygenase
MISQQYNIRSAILQRLRAETQPAHKRLETRLDLVKATLTTNDYRKLLEKFYGFYVPEEAALQPVCDASLPEIRFEGRRKARLLLRDLAALGLSRQQIEALPLCDRIPEIAGPAEALGCLYVLEGSTLGGQIISRHLQSALGIRPENGGAFFASYGARVGVMWRTFGAVLTSYAARENQDAAIVQSACDIFAALEVWLCDE